MPKEIKSFEEKALHFLVSSTEKSKKTLFI
jgi:hypothetical protein